MKALSNLTPAMSLLITGVVIVGIGVLVKGNLIDSKMADTAITFILGGGAGAALVGGQMTPRGDQ